MPTRNLFSLTLTLLLGLLLLGANCTIPTDDDDSAADDDDSAGDDDDSAGDDDDSAAPILPMDLQTLDIYCEGDPDLATRDQSGSWEFLVNFTGYADSVKLFMWDGFGNEHYQDPNQPWGLSNIDYSVELGQWDEYGIGGGSVDIFGDDVPDLGNYQTIGEATAANGTILDCYDANGVPNVEDHNYMVCATDYYDATNNQCWFCGDDLGDDVFGQSSVDYQVGLWTDPGDGTVYEMTTDITAEAAVCIRSSLAL